MRAVICEYTSRAAEKLRGENRTAKRISVFMRTNRFNQNERQYMPNISAELPIPTDDTRDLDAMAMCLLKSSWKDGYRYMKAGVMLSDFYEPRVYQSGLFDEASPRPKSKELMSVLDHINNSGKGRVFIAGQGITKDWGMKRDKLSPAYTKNWSDLPIAK